jgi:hypothetical protein
MKKFYALLMLTIVNVSFSQDSRIFQNVWYLTNIIVNGVSNIPPNGDMYIDFRPTNFTVKACTTMYGSVNFGNNNTSFSASNYLYTLDLCPNPPADNYQSIYFPFFHDGIYANLSAVYNFTYNISESLGVKTLTINSMFNQQAVYSSVSLANDNFEKLDFSFFPNPSKEYLEINLNNGFTENAIAEFYNEIGQICKTTNLNSNKTKIEIKDLSNGIYIVKIKTKNEVLTKKFIKI